MAGRAWGIWTKGKLDVLRKYLDAFTTATKNKADERIYLDLFAGEAENEDRLTGESLAGSARIALSISDPPFTRLRFFETERNAKALENVLQRKFLCQDFKVLGGDSNDLISAELESLKCLNWAPTFAFVDPNGIEAEWRTLVALAKFKEDNKYKAELFYLFSPQMFQRFLRVDGGEVRLQDRETINAVFGTEGWENIYQDRLNGTIEPAQATDEYLNLMRWRMETELGYCWTHPLKVRNEGSRVIYYMIFATDHCAGHKIISNIYASAAAEFPKMREEARQRRRAMKDETNSFLDADQLVALSPPPQPGERFYEHEPPTRPSFMKEE